MSSALQLDTVRETERIARLRTRVLTATFRCDAPARCGAFANERRVVAADGGGRGYILALGWVLAYRFRPAVE
jgi:hypothetical protein